MVPISSWRNQEGVSLEELFITKEENPRFYDTAERLHQETQQQIRAGKPPSKQFYEPVEQLSPKGLALMSYIYARKDKSEKQPLIASSKEDFKNFIKLMGNAKEGSELTLIVQLTDNTHPFGSKGHKTTFKIRKNKSFIEMVNIDSVSDGIFGWVAAELAETALKENIATLGKDSTPQIKMAYQKVHKKPEQYKKHKQSDFFSRQSSDYECGVFAIKDAREANRDPDFMDQVFTKGKADEKDPDYSYDIPKKFLKSIQSRAYMGEIEPSHGKEIVTRRGKTLKETWEKHEARGGYVYHFSKKFKDYVKNFYEQNKNNPEVIKQAINKYDAGKITAEELEKRYGPASQIKSKPKTQTDEFKSEMDNITRSLQKNNRTDEKTPELRSPLIPQYKKESGKKISASSAQSPSVSTKLAAEQSKPVQPEKEAKEVEEIPETRPRRGNLEEEMPETRPRRGNLDSDHNDFSSTRRRR